MKLEDQVCSLELAKRLKELRVKQYSLFSWQIGSNGIPTLNLSFMGEIKCEDYSAFTVAELGELLSDYLCVNNLHPNLFIAKGTQQENCWTIGYSIMYESITPFYTEINEADARAKMLIHLLENGLIKNE